MAADGVVSRWSADERTRWDTFDTTRVVLAIARTFTSAVRLIDALSVFRGLYVQVLFAVDEGSAFSSGVADFLRDCGEIVVPWGEISQVDYHLVVTASENVELEPVTSPIVVLPHGIGFHGYVPDSAGTGMRTSGVVPDRQLRDKRVTMVISHPAQAAQLRRSHPLACGHCVLAGDATFDRIMESLPFRDEYRHALGLRPGRRLVVITSTWGRGSLLGSRPELPARLLAELPADEYRVAMIVHPNIASRHGEHYQRQVLGDAFEAGLLRIPPAAGWQATLIAADLIIGDNGSVTLYGAAATDRPLLLGAAKPTIVPGTPAHELAGSATHLSADLPLREQVERAITTHRSGSFAALRDQMFAGPGTAAEALRDLLLDRLDLDPPDQPAAVRAVPDPRPEVEEPRSFVVHSRPVGDGEVEVRRVPFAVRRGRVAEPGFLRHLCVGEGERDPYAAANASVLVRTRIGGHDEAADWIRRRLTASQALLAAAATDEGCLVGMRSGRWFTCEGRGLDPALAASAIYTLVVGDAVAEPPSGPATGSVSEPLPDGPIRVRTGAVRRTMTVRTRR